MTNYHYIYIVMIIITSINKKTDPSYTSCSQQILSFFHALCASIYTDEDDYTPLSGFGGLVSFNNLNRRRCIHLRITEDEVNEFEESFQLRLDSLPKIDLPSKLVLDPVMTSIAILDNEGICCCMRIR